MTNQVLFDSILTGGIVFFSMLAALMFVFGFRHRNAVIKSIISAQNYLKEHIEGHNERLKKSLSNTLTPDLDTRIEDIKQSEKENFNKLIDLFLDNTPAAIEVMPVIINNILLAHVDLLQRVDLMKGAVAEPIVAVEEPKIEATVKEDPLDDEFQYQALIEQLRYEKQDFANKYKESSDLIIQIYNHYKEKLELESVESFKNLKITEIASIFKIGIDEKPAE